MKKIFAIALVAMMTMTANAQVYVGGGIGFQTSSNDGNSETTIKILPEIGYNLDENWAVGIAVGYGENQTKINGVKVKNKVFEVAPYARYTFVKLDKINVFVDGTVDYAHADADGLKSNSFGVGVKPGVAVNLNDKLSFVTHFGFLGYQYDKLDVDGAKATNTFGFDLDGNNLTFGLYYNF
jgi:outer membrane autotransporter protein